MSNAIETLLCEVFKAQGLRNPARAAHDAAEGFDRAKRDERIYDATASCPTETVARRFGITKRRVEQIVHAYLQSRHDKS